MYRLLQGIIAIFTGLSFPVHEHVSTCLGLNFSSIFHTFVYQSLTFKVYF